MLKPLLKPLLLTGLILVGHTASAAVWLTNLTVKSVAYYWDGYNDAVEVTWLETVASGCAVTDTNRKATSWATPSTPLTERMQVVGIRMAPALSALSANMKVDLLVDQTNCNATYGANLWGVRVHN